MSTWGCVINAQEMQASGIPTAADKSCQHTKPAPSMILNAQGCPPLAGLQCGRGATVVLCWMAGNDTGKWAYFVVEDGMCCVGESQHRNHQGKSFHPANAGIEPRLSLGLRNSALEWSNYCSVCELRLKSQQRWCLALAQGFALLTGTSAQAGTAVQLCCWWHWHSWWEGCGRICLGDMSRSQQPGPWSVSEALGPADLSQNPKQTQVKGNVISKSVISILPQWDAILTPFGPL